jgi:hypothetical protein
MITSFLHGFPLPDKRPESLQELDFGFLPNNENGLLVCAAATMNMALRAHWLLDDWK